MMQSAGPRSLRDHLPACVSTRPHRARKGQPIRTDLTAPLLTLANYLYIYLIRLLPHSSAPLPSLSVSLFRLRCPGVNPNPDPNPLLFLFEITRITSLMLTFQNLCDVIFQIRFFSVLPWNLASVVLWYRRSCRYHFHYHFFINFSFYRSD